MVALRKCIQCGGRAVKGQRLCEACREKQRARNAAWRAGRVGVKGEGEKASVPDYT